MPYYRLYYHFVWTTKNRAPFITIRNQKAIFAMIQDKVATLNGIAHALNGMPDHVHLVASVPPSVRLSDFIGQIKGVSSHLARSLDDPGDFAWQAEYGFFQSLNLMCRQLFVMSKISKNTTPNKHLMLD